jgi:ATP adenylyltransferase
MVAGASKGQSLHPSGCKSYVAAHYKQAPRGTAIRPKKRVLRRRLYDRRLTPDRLWAPWRIQYITGSKSDECIFCAKPALDDESALIVHRGERCFVILNAYPYASGHVMVAPYEHTSDLAGLDGATAGELMALTQATLGALARAYGPEGYNVGANLGSVAGAGIADHVHMHVVPRWEGDTNFMPVLGDVRVLPEALEETHRKLRDAFAASAGAGRPGAAAS